MSLPTWDGAYCERNVILNLILKLPGPFMMYRDWNVVWFIKAYVRRLQSFLLVRSESKKDILWVTQYNQDRMMMSYGMTSSTLLIELMRV